MSLSCIRCSGHCGLLLLAFPVHHILGMVNSDRLVYLMGKRFFKVPCELHFEVHHLTIVQWYTMRPEYWLLASVQGLQMFFPPTKHSTACLSMILSPTCLAYNLVSYIFPHALPSSLVLAWETSVPATCFPWPWVGFGCLGSYGLSSHLHDLNPPFTVLASTGFYLF